LSIFPRGFKSFCFTTATLQLYLKEQKQLNMSLPVNDKKGNNKQGNNTKEASKGSKFIKGAGSSKAAGPTKKVRSTGANRGS
jgi:hypothetical protein